MHHTFCTSLILCFMFCLYMSYSANEQRLCVKLCRSVFSVKAVALFALGKSTRSCHLTEGACLWSCIMMYGEYVSSVWLAGIVCVCVWFLRKETAFIRLFFFLSAEQVTLPYRRRALISLYHANVIWVNGWCCILPWPSARLRYFHPFSGCLSNRSWNVQSLIVTRIFA